MIIEMNLKEFGWEKEVPSKKNVIITNNFIFIYI